MSFAEQTITKLEEMKLFSKRFNYMNDINTYSYVNEAVIIQMMQTAAKM